MSKLKEIIGYAESLGLNVDIGPWEQLPAGPQSRDLGAHFDAKSKTVYVSTPYSVPFKLLHEMGHWVAASKKQRTQTNYGLRMSLYGSERSRKKEIQACEVQFAIMMQLGYSQKYIKHIAVYELSYMPDQFQKAVNNGKKLLAKFR